jgi:hypothetical protein
MMRVLILLDPSIAQTPWARGKKIQAANNIEEKKKKIE